jgi:Cu(I)/Ag(I) efflux system membrane protein CusA/SilA
MTFATMSIGLIPILWSTGTGSEIMKRIAAPMVGGIVTSFILELLVYPAVYLVWKEAALKEELGELGGQRIRAAGYLGLGQAEPDRLVGVSQHPS